MTSSQKVALITGASGGVGRALCDVFKDDGYHVIATDLVNAGDVVCDHFVESDLTELCNDETAMIGFVKQLGLNDCGLTVLVNNAAIQILNPIEAITLENWRDTLNVNLLAPFLLTQVLLPYLEQSRGSVVNIGSVHARATKPSFVCYATSKAALAGLTRSLAVDLGSRIRVNAINPAAVETSMLLEGFKGKDELFAQLESVHPVGRIGQPLEIAQLVLFLASSHASFITGATIDVDGGVLSRLHDPD